MHQKENLNNFIITSLYKLLQPHYLHAINYNSVIPYNDIIACYNFSLEQNQFRPVPTIGVQVIWVISIGIYR